MSKKSDTKEWTLMFYFASDNPLAPEIVTQLKALKNAGYHQKVNVVAYFDPQSAGTPTHIFDVNAFYKLQNGDSKVGFDRNDPYVRTLKHDRLWGAELSRDGKTTIRDLIQEVALKPGKTYNLPPPPLSHSKRNTHFGTANHNGHSKTHSVSKQSLQTFLNFCASHYKAEHYMLFILGHGLIVGDDVFLYDQHAAKHSVTLRDLHEALDKFKTNIRRGEFEFVSFHSCSMSSLEVAFELQGTAKYMLASQGPAFVGSWPYTAILLRVFKGVDEGSLKTQPKIEAMLEDVYHYVRANSADFVMAGYSFDLCLCDLSRASIASVEKPLKDLSKELIQGLTSDLVTACILLAHWKSQSYWNENYTDLYDYCFCLSDYCAKFKKAVKDPRHYKKIQVACDKVMKALEGRYRSYPGRLVIFSGFVGPESQYSHGFSIFFPWTRPTADRAIWPDYKEYKFKGTDWHTFLDKYWGPEKYEEPITGTMRDSHQAEVSKPRTGRPRQHDPLHIRQHHLDEDILSWMFNADGPLNLGDALNDGTDKPNSQSSTGDGCTCGSIKNYRRDTRARFNRGRPALPMSGDAVALKGARKKL